jgi:hypothetical protein
MRVKLVEHQTHARHETVHICRFAILIPPMSSQRFLECFKVLHPLDCEIVWLSVCLVEYENEGETSFIQNPRWYREFG